MDNKLNLMVNFMGADKLSGSIKSIMMNSKSGGIQLGLMKRKAKELNSELNTLQREMGQVGVPTLAMVTRQKQLAAQIAETNRAIDIQGKRLSTVNKIQSRAARVQSAAGGAGAAMSIGITAPGIMFGQASIAAYLESAEAIGQVEASLMSMGRQSEFTSIQLQKMATGEMRKSLYDDDQILREVTSTMLTFGKIQGPMFERAQAAAVDLSVKFKKDLGGSAIMVGKALQDPVKGVSALSRVGVSFSASQKAMIKSMVAAGNSAGAQKLILAELEKQVAGSAEAARKANPGAAAKQDLDELQETVGAKLLPIMMKVTTAVGSLADKFNSASPATQQMIVYAGIAAVALGPLLIGVAGLAAAVGFAAGPLAAMASGTMMAGKAILFVGRAMMMNPIGLLVTGLAVGAYLIYTHWNSIKGYFRGALAFLKGFVGGLQAFGGNMVLGLVSGIIAMGPRVVGALKGIMQSAINNVKSFLGIKSPSRLFMTLGNYTSQGMAIGIDKGRGDAIRAAGRLASGVAAAGALSLAPATAGTLQRSPQGQQAADGNGAVYNIRITINAGPNADATSIADQVMRQLDQVAGIKARRSYDDGE